MILTGCFAILSGFLVDRFGPRIVITIGSCFIALGYLLMSTVNSEWQYYLYYGVLVSVGMGFMVVPLLSTAAKWFTKKVGLVSGIVISGIGVGIVVMPQVANKLISAYNWRGSFIILGIAALILIMGLAQFLRRPPDQVRPAQEANKKPNIQIQGLSTGEAVRTRQFWLIFMCYLCINIAVLTVMVHIVPHTTDIGFSATAAATVLAVIGLVSVGAKIFMGSLADKIGNRNAIIIVAIVLAVSFTFLLFANQIWTLYIFAVIFSLGYSGSSATHSPVLAEYFGLRAHGALFGLTSLAANGGGAIGALLAGFIFDGTGSYNLAFIIGATMGIIILALSIPLRHLGKRAEIGAPVKIDA